MVGLQPETQLVSSCAATKHQSPYAIVVRATPRGASRLPPCQVNGSPAGRKWTNLLARAPGGARARSFFIEEPGRRTWSSMCVLCKESDGRLHQLSHWTVRLRPTTMQMSRPRDQWLTQGRAQGARSRFPLCDSGGRRGSGGAPGTSGSGRLRRRPSAPSDGPSKRQSRGQTRWSGEWRGGGRWRGPGRSWLAYVTGGSDSWSWGPAPGVATVQKAATR